jgi:hypothetical protein
MRWLDAEHAGCQGVISGTIIGEKENPAQQCCVGLKAKNSGRI